MGSLISVGEKINNFDCSGENLTAFTISEDALEKMKQPAFKEGSGGIGDCLMMEIAKGYQTDGYLKIMRCVQNEHSLKFGLSVECIENLCGSLVKYTKSVNQVAEDEEKNVIDCLKKEMCLFECNDKVTNYADAVEKYMKQTADKNSKEIKVDPTIFTP